MSDKATQAALPEFAVPVREDDLLEKNGDKYRVTLPFDVDAASTSALSQKIIALDEELRSDATVTCQPRVFDVLFRIVSHFSILDADVRARILDLLCAGLSDITAKIEAAAVGSTKKTPEVLRNTAKMITFLLCWLVRQFELDSRERAAAPSNAAADGTGRGRKRPREEDEGPWASESRRERAVAALGGLADSKGLARLWRMQQVEEPFLTLFWRTAVTMMESALNCKSKPVRAGIAELLGALMKRYGQQQLIIPAAMQLLHSHEHSVIPLVEVLEVCATKYDLSQVVRDAVREIGRLGEKDLAKETTLLAKNTASFLAEVTTRLPLVVLDAVPVLTPHLGGESHIMRRGVIETLGILAAKAFSDETATEGPQKGKTKASILRILEERFTDVSSYVRIDVMHTWITLAQTEGVVPLDVWQRVAQKTVQRMMDKTSTVRKVAVQLMTALLQYNPISPKLRISVLQDKIKLCKRIADRYNIESLDAPAPDEEEEDQPDEGADGASSSAATTIEQSELDALFSGTLFEGSPFKKSRNGKRVLRVFYSWVSLAVDLAGVLLGAIPLLIQLLSSKVSSDVQEAIQFFVVATEFALEGSEEGLRMMLPLVFSKEAPIREKVVSAYSKLFFSCPKTTMIAKNLISLVSGEANQGDLTCLEEVVRLACDSGGLVHKDVFPHLLDALGNSKSPEERRGAMKIIGMVAASDPAIVAEKVNAIASCALGDKWDDDVVLAKYACIALQRLRRSAIEHDSRERSALMQQLQQQQQQQQQQQEEEKEPEGKKPKKKTAAERKAEEAASAVSAPQMSAVPQVSIARMPNEHGIFARLIAVLIETTPLPYTKWVLPAEQSINAIYALAEMPDALMESVIKQLHSRALDGDSCGVETLCRLFFVVGHTALRQLVHIDLVHKHLEKEAKKKQAAEQNRKKRAPTSDSKKGKKKRKGEEEEEGAEEQVEGYLEPVDAVIVQTEEKIALAERELVLKDLLGVYGPMIVAVCKNSSQRYNDPLLRSAVVLALCKYMVVSDEFCKDNLQLLFTVLATAPEPEIRSNIAIILGDICFRFPNAVEHWTKDMFKTLRDGDPQVRKNAVMVLTHLILNDMIKLKGQISELALSCEDPDKRVSDLARLFFSELAQKGNAVYNALPDIISPLSASDTVSDEVFRSVVRYLFSFMNKERQFETLLEKLCQRFRSDANIRQSRNVAYCLTLLTFNDKCIKKLSELFPCFMEKLQDEEVHGFFMALITKTRKMAKPELKAALDEFEKKINSATGASAASGESAPPVVGEDGEAQAVAAAPAKDGEDVAVVPASAPDAKGKKAVTSTPRGGAKRGRGRGAATASGRTPAKRGTTPSRKRKRDESSDEEEDVLSLPSSDGESEGEEEEKPKRKMPTRAAAAKSSSSSKKVVVSSGSSAESSSDSESSSDEKTKSTKKKADSSSSEDEKAKKKKADSSSSDEKSSSEEEAKKTTKKKQPPAKKTPAKGAAASSAKKKGRRVVESSSEED